MKLTASVDSAAAGLRQRALLARGSHSFAQRAVVRQLLEPFCARRNVAEEIARGLSL